MKYPDMGRSSSSIQIT
uniref:Uncharacterized protein n=1 Tax=Lepeophtheirus salmonis TaxID=72036 RepID=A0A0K2UIE6_LEPSM